MSMCHNTDMPNPNPIRITYIHTYIHTIIHPSIHPSIHTCIHASLNGDTSGWGLTEMGTQRDDPKHQQRFQLYIFRADIIAFQSTVALKKLSPPPPLISATFPGD